MSTFPRSDPAEKREGMPKMLKDSSFQWEDPLDLEGELSEDERMVRDTARGFAQDYLMPRIVEAYREEKYDAQMLPEMGKLGLLGPTVPEEYGGAGLGYVSYGVIAREFERVDSGYRSAMSVQSSLVMYPIYAYGTEAQRRKYLPKLATAELIGCFGLTEPDHGSDPGAMATRAEKVAGGYKLNGAKTWISNAPVADLAVVWAKLDNVIRGFIVERGTKGFSTPKIEGKLSLRASITGEIVLEDCLIPEDNLLPNVRGLAGPFGSRLSSGIRQSSSTISPVMEARKLSLPSILGVEKPLVPRSTMKPRMTLASLAHTTARSATGALEIQVLAPLSL